MKQQEKILMTLCSISMLSLLFAFRVKIPQHASLPSMTTNAAANAQAAAAATN
jgi:hypothetical protein